ncbi:alginate lyase [Alteromonas genovensis]|uniref:Alginate lyase n=1 Tax=Alteromonas genovensis TaxID=471225 RepID=A0A6N9TDJ4_9ALTE|nr:polysaccharide lyase 6 family protein [Alteromonas genovensis]NDW14552.1 alginate lyase [Alteromonas genovensis]
MRLSTVYLASLLFTSASFLSFSIDAADYVVSSQEEYKNVSSSLTPGDTIILTSGVWQDFEILLEGEGTSEAPITLKAESKGDVVLSGKSNLRLAGEHLVVSGLVFKNGYTPSSAVIAFRKNKESYANHSRVTDVVIDNFNNPDKQESDYWVALYGKHNRFDHNHLEGKRNKGVTVAVRLNSEASQENYHKIDHNYFGYRPTFGSNGGETLRIGTSHFSLTNSYTLVENNIFEQTNGEVEIISVKSGKNTLRGNVFLSARGTLTLRHGNGNIVENNVFLGNEVAHTGGIRVINKDQVIRNNYLEGLKGYRFGSGFTIMNGVPNSPINRYHQVENATITNNTFINVDHIHLAAGSDAERSAAPKSTIFKNNVVYNQNDTQPFSIFDDVSGISFRDNVTNTETASPIASGFDKQKISLKREGNGLFYAKGIAQGVDESLSVIDKESVGTSYYPKTVVSDDFDTGNTIAVEASAKALKNAIATAQNGDVLELAEGEFVVPSVLYIDDAITIKARNSQKTTLYFERTALFEIRDGGSLKLEGLVISGAQSPDSSGNSVVRTKKWGMVNNYRFTLANTIVKDLDINHSFSFFTSGKGAFADAITLSNNTFTSVSGDILRLDKEIEDYGIYNAEYVTLKQNTFTDIKGGVLKLYRGGTDESTFGPHLLMTNNVLNNVGNGKRNKKGASVFLHGVQVTDVQSNEFIQSGPLIIDHTVGEPITSVIDNTFTATPTIQIQELHAEGPHTAILKNNIVAGKEASNL